MVTSKLIFLPPNMPLIDKSKSWYNETRLNISVFIDNQTEFDAINVTYYNAEEASSFVKHNRLVKRQSIDQRSFFVVLESLESGNKYNVSVRSVSLGHESRDSIETFITSENLLIRSVSIYGSKLEL